MKPLPEITRCGLPGVDRVPVGMHACHFYTDRDELTAALVPYIGAGLKANERCLWITAPPLPAAEARRAMREAWPGADAAIEKGALRIFDFDPWYVNGQGAKAARVVDSWLAEEKRALADGFSGLRISSNTNFLRRAEWSAFMEHERALSDRSMGRRILTLCSYAAGGCDDRKAFDLKQAHHCAFERNDNDWQVVTRP